MTATTGSGTDLVIEMEGTFNKTFYRPGTNFSGNYVELRGVSNQNTGSAALFVWSTSGGQVTATGSEITVKATPLSIMPSGTSGLWLTGGDYDMVTVTNAGSDTDFRVRGQFRIQDSYARD